MTDVVMAVLGLAGLALTVLTAFSLFYSHRSARQTSDENNGSLRQLVADGFDRSDRRMDKLVGRVANVESHCQRIDGHVAELSAGLAEVRRAVDLPREGSS